MLRPVCPRRGEDERAGAARAMLPPESSPAHLGTPRGLPREVLAQKQPLGIHTDCTKGEQEWAFFFFSFLTQENYLISEHFITLKTASNEPLN